ncbi:MAG: PD-(D/E)XK nuclease family protein [Parcubacteria group bacterium]|nr:PD-(D/E)XK nuclease family protein [Parcubacteria group bacterium]
MRTSYSALDTYKTCPLQYKFRQIDKEKTPKRPEQVFGTVVHDALKYMFERDPLYPTLDEVVSHYKSAWKSAAENVMWRDEAQKEKEEAMYMEEGLAILKSFAKKNNPWNFNAVELESRFSVDVKDPESGETHTLVGIMDRLDKDPDSSQYEIIDYKTGKKMPSVAMLEDNMQLGLYSLVIVERWPDLKPEDITVSLYFLRHNEKVSTTMAQEKLELVKKNILEVIRAIEKSMEENNFPPTPGPLCGWCDFRHLCPMWAHEYKKEEEYTPDDNELKEALSEFLALKDTEDQTKKRMAALKDIINRYLDAQGLERVFSSDSYVTRSSQERVSYDMEKAEPALREAGVWERVLAPDKKKLEDMLPDLPESVQKELEEARKVSVSKTLRVSKKKGVAEEEEEE